MHSEWEQRKTCDGREGPGRHAHVLSQYFTAVLISSPDLFLAQYSSSPGTTLLYTCAAA